MSVRVTFVADDVSGGSIGSFFDDTSFANAQAAVATVSNGFLYFPSPVDPSSGGVSMEPRAHATSRIFSIVTIAADPDVTVH
jgi:hypothetical protein